MKSSNIYIKSIKRITKFWHYFPLLIMNVYYYVNINSFNADALKGLAVLEIIISSILIVLLIIIQAVHAEHCDVKDSLLNIYESKTLNLCDRVSIMEELYKIEKDK